MEEERYLLGYARAGSNPVAVEKVFYVIPREVFSFFLCVCVWFCFLGSYF